MRIFQKIILFFLMSQKCRETPFYGIYRDFIWLFLHFLRYVIDLYRFGIRLGLKKLRVVCWRCLTDWWTFWSMKIRVLRVVGIAETLIVNTYWITTSLLRVFYLSGFNNKGVIVKAMALFKALNRLWYLFLFSSLSRFAIMALYCARFCW